MSKNDNYNSVMQLLGKKRANKDALPSLSCSDSLEKEYKPIVVAPTNEFIQLDNEEFDYKILEGNLSLKLKEKEIALKNVFSNAYTQIGSILKEAQNLLASHNKKIGIFEAWYTSLGLKKDSVYRLISRFELLANCEKKERDLLEAIPLSLAYEISKNTCSQHLRKAVFSGEIKTLKEFQKKKRELSLEVDKAYAAKKLNKKEFQKKKARLLNSFAIFQKKSNLLSDDPNLMVSLFNYLNKAEKALNLINELLE